MKKTITTITLGLMSLLMNAQIPSYVPTSGLIAYYPLNGNANDLSSNAINGTTYSTTPTIDRHGITNNALNFDGINSYIDLGVSLPINNNITNNYSISFWIKMNPTSIPNCIFYNGTTGSLPDRRIAVLASQSIHSHSKAPGGTIVATGYALEIFNKWNHVVVTKGSSDTKVFFNGGIIRHVTNSATNLLVNPVFQTLVGKAIQSGTGNYSGDIDELIIYNRELNYNEVANLTNASNVCTKTDILTGLIAQYDFSGNANDNSGNNYNGIVNNATLTTDRFGNINRAYAFNGTNSSISLGPVPFNAIDTLDARPFSLSYWFNSNTGGNQACIGNGTPTLSIVGFNTGIYNGTPSINVPDNGITSLNCMVSGNGVALSQWHHITWVYSTSESLLYLDGVLSSTTCRSNSVLGNEIKAGVGYSGIFSPYFNGKIDDIRLYKRWLTPCDVDSLYNIPNQIPTIISTISVASNDLYSFDKCIYLKKKSNNNLILNVYDLNGRLIYSTEAREKNVTNLSSGLYFVNIMDENKNIVLTKKIIIE